jgi:excisionase family DNA binding protein
MQHHAATFSSTVRLGPNSKPQSPALPMLTPTHAWRLLCRRTGGKISRTTFYRWITSGRVGAVRMGFRYLVPLPLLEEIIQKCLDGERI